MKKFLAVVLVGLMATSANALNIWIVAKTGPHAYIEGTVPNLLNGSVGNNASGGGLAPSKDLGGGAGLVIAFSTTGKIGVVVELVGGTICPDDDCSNVRGPNQLSTAIVFFNKRIETAFPGTGINAIDLANVESKAANDAGNLWDTINFSTGMSHWITTDGGNGTTLTGSSESPKIDEYHSIQFDDVAAGGGGGRTAGDLPVVGNVMLNLVEITVHCKGEPGAEARVVFDTANSEFFNEQSGQYGFRANQASGHFGDAGSPGGYWVPNNGNTKQNAFPILCNIPEPASLSLLVIGAAAMLRRRVM